MTRVLLLATIVMSLASAFLSFRTKQQAENLLEEKRQALSDAQKQKAEAARLSAAQKESETKMEELSKGKGTLMEDLNKAREDVKTREAEVAKLKEEGGEKAGEMSKLQEKLKAAEEKVATMSKPAPNPEAEAKVLELTAQLQRSQQAVAQSEKMAQTMGAQVEELRKKVEIEKKRAEKVEKSKDQSFAFGADPAPEGRSKLSAKTKGAKKDAAAGPLNGGEMDKPAAPEDDEEAEKKRLAEKLKRAQGQVVSYDSGWNLVVVNLGDTDGVTMETPMQVMRKGQVVAKLRIARVEPKQFTATLLPPEGKKKVEVARGDEVLYALR